MHWTVHLEGGPRRVNHAAVTVGDKIYSFGGYCTGEDYHVLRPIDVHVLNTVSLRWTVIVPPSVNYSQTRNMPFQRYGHTVVAYGDLAYLWGGRNNEGACKFLFCFDTVTHRWSRPLVSGSIPGARDGHSACVIDHFMYIFGGYEEEADRFSQDVHCLDFRTHTWSFIKTRGSPPSWRDFHSASAIGQRMYIFGGRGDSHGPLHSQEEVYCNQIAYLETKTRFWVRPETRGVVPVGRRSHSAFVYRGQLYIFGGYNGIHNRHFGDLHCYDVDTSTWSCLQVKGIGPCPRRRQCCCLVGNKVFLFGGTSPNPDASMAIVPQHQFHLEDIGTDFTLLDHSDLHVLDFCSSFSQDVLHTDGDQTQTGSVIFAERHQVGDQRHDDQQQHQQANHQHRMKTAEATPASVAGHRSAATGTRVRPLQKSAHSKATLEALQQELYATRLSTSPDKQICLQGVVRSGSEARCRACRCRICCQQRIPNAFGLRTRGSRAKTYSKQATSRFVPANLSAKLCLPPACIYPHVPVVFGALFRFDIDKLDLGKNPCHGVRLLGHYI